MAFPTVAGDLDVTLLVKAGLEPWCDCNVGCSFFSRSCFPILLDKQETPGKCVINEGNVLTSLKSCPFKLLVMDVAFDAETMIQCLTPTSRYSLPAPPEESFALIFMNHTYWPKIHIWVLWSIHIHMSTYGSTVANVTKNTVKLRTAWVTSNDSARMPSMMSQMYDLFICHTSLIPSLALHAVDHRKNARSILPRWPCQFMISRTEWPVDRPMMCRIFHENPIVSMYGQCNLRKLKSTGHGKLVCSMGRVVTLLEFLNYIWDIIYAVYR